MPNDVGGGGWRDPGEDGGSTGAQTRDPERYMNTTHGNLDEEPRSALVLLPQPDVSSAGRTQLTCI